MAVIVSVTVIASGAEIVKVSPRVVVPAPVIVKARAADCGAAYDAEVVLVDAYWAGNLDEP